jgi:hypothetical protein
MSKCSGCQAETYGGDCLRCKNESLRARISALEALIEEKDEALKYCAEANLDGLHSVKRVSHDALALTPDSIQSRAQAQARVIEAALAFRAKHKVDDEGALHEFNVFVDKVDALAALEAAK